MFAVCSTLDSEGANRPGGGRLPGDEEPGAWAVGEGVADARGGLYLSHILPEPDEALVWVARLLLCRPPDEIAAVLETQGSNLLEALGRMAPQSVSVVLWAPRSPTPAELEASIGRLTQCCQQVPWLPVVVVIEPTPLRAWLAGTSRSRVRTMVLEGLVHVGLPDADARSTGLDIRGPRAWLQHQNLPAEVLAQFDEAARAVAQLLSELGRWISRRSANRLQAVVLFDEADLYLPAQRQPPTKEPMEHLLRRARSGGLGILLATRALETSTTRVVTPSAPGLSGVCGNARRCASCSRCSAKGASMCPAAYPLRSRVSSS